MTAFDKITYPGHALGKVQDYQRMLAAAATARGLKMETYCHGFWSRTGIEFRDRNGRYGALTHHDLHDLEETGPWRMTAAKLLDTLSEQGLDIRLNRELDLLRRQLARYQLAFNFEERAA